MPTNVKFGAKQINNPTPTILNLWVRVITISIGVFLLWMPSAPKNFFSQDTQDALVSVLGLVAALINALAPLFGVDVSSSTKVSASKVSAMDSEAVNKSHKSNSKNMKSIILIVVLSALTATAFSQSAFKKLPKPTKKYGALYGGVAESKPINAFRFSAPTAGTAFYKGGEIKVVTGIGFGLQRLHFVDSTQKYYADYSVKLTAFAQGNVNPSFTDKNIFGLGVVFGFWNELIQAGVIWNVPTTEGSKGKVGIVATLGIPLNN